MTIAGGLSSTEMPWNPIEGPATMTAYRRHRVRRHPGDQHGVRSLFAVGALLFLFTFLLNAVSERLVRRFREV